MRLTPTFRYLFLIVCCFSLPFEVFGQSTNVAAEYYVALTERGMSEIAPLNNGGNISTEDIYREALFFQNLGALPLKKDPTIKNLFQIRIIDKGLFARLGLTNTTSFRYVEPIVETSTAFGEFSEVTISKGATSSPDTYVVAHSAIQPSATTYPVLATAKASATSSPTPTPTPTPTPDPCRTFMGNNDPEDNNWSYNLYPGANVRRAWCTTTGNSNITIAILGSGITLDHPDLVENLWKDSNPDSGSLKETTDGFNVFNTSVRNPPKDDQGLGTYVSGIIGAKGNNALGIAGVAWNVKLMPVRIAKKNAIFPMLVDTDLGKIVDGINYIIKKKNEGNNIVTVYNYINLISDSAGVSPTLRAKIDELGNLGILFVTAAGDIPANLNFQASYPSSFAASTMIAVGSYYLSPPPTVAYSPLSNFGDEKVHLAAPGQEIKSCWLSSQYVTPATGSTVASGAIVAGISILVKSRFPLFTVTQLKQKILNAVRVIPDFTGKVITKGGADAEKAVTVAPRIAL